MEQMLKRDVRTKQKFVGVHFGLFSKIGAITACLWADGSKPVERHKLFR